MDLVEKIARRVNARIAQAKARHLRFDYSLILTEEINKEA